MSHSPFVDMMMQEKDTTEAGCWYSDMQLHSVKFTSWWVALSILMPLSTMRKEVENLAVITVL